MNKLIIEKDGKLTTTSKIIADVFNKAHRNVLADIEKLNCSAEFSSLNFQQSDYKTNRGKTYQCYNITEKGFYFLCMGFTGDKAAKWKESFIEEFESLRKGTLNIDQRMTEISKNLDSIKQAGSEWSELGRIINKNKKMAIASSKALLDEVQLKLEY